MAGKTERGVADAADAALARPRENGGLDAANVDVSDAGKGAAGAAARPCSRAHLTFQP